MDALVLLRHDQMARVRIRTSERYFCLIAAQVASGWGGDRSCQRVGRRAFLMMFSEPQLVAPDATPPRSMRAAPSAEVTPRP